MKKTIIVFFFIFTLISILSFSEEIKIVIPLKGGILKDVVIDNNTENTIQNALSKSKIGKYAESIEILTNLYEIANEDLKGRIKNRLGYAYYYMKDYKNAEREWKSVVNRIVPSSEKDICDSKLRLAYLKYAEKNFDTALEYFLDIATGSIKADYDSAKDASLRAAFLFKKRLDLKQSENIFRQVMNQVTEVNDLLYAKLQVAGILWEMGKGDGGILNTNQEKQDAFLKSRQLCLEIINDINITDKTRVEGSYIKAIAELIYIETFYFLKNYQQTIDLCNIYISKWSKFLKELEPYNYEDPERPIRRQLITAMGWLAISYFNEKYYSECIYLCKEINSQKWDEKDPYKNFNVFGYAYLYEALSYESMGENDKAFLVRKICYERFPKWYNTIFPQIETLPNE